MKITFWGASRTVTGSCFLLEHNQSRFLVDCGLFQGSKGLKERNYRDFPFDPAEIDFLLLTHAHIDHSGLIPKLFLKGFEGPVYATEGTVALAGILLPDCGYIQEMEVERKNRKLMRAGAKLLEPIYTSADAYECLTKFKGMDYDKPFSPAPGITVNLKEAGHILGSSMLDIAYTEAGEERHFIFTGDIGRPTDFIVKKPTTFENATFVAMESTYGNRSHLVKEADTVTLARIIRETFQAGGNVIIPAFAIDRTQDLLMVLEEMVDKGEITNHSIYVDSPLAIAATEIFADFREYFNDTATKRYQVDEAPFSFPGLNFSRTVEESLALNKIKSGAIIISASGMADAGRIKHHLKHNLWREECTVIFIGYQAEGTLGRRLLDGEKLVRIHGEEVAVHANIVNLYGFSAHADREELLDWVKSFPHKPQSIFVVHGEESSAVDFANLLQSSQNVHTITPFIGDVFDLEMPQTMAANIPDCPKGEDMLPEIITQLLKLAAGGKYSQLAQVREFLSNLNQ